MGLNLSPLMFIILTGLAGIACGYYTYRSAIKKESWLKTGFWFMFFLSGLSGSLSEILRNSAVGGGLARVMDETFTVAAVIGIILWICDWLAKNTNLLKKF